MSHHATPYQDPAVYDILHAPGTASEVDALERIWRRYVTGTARRGAWLEPACGTGRYLRLSARRGRAVIGFDRNAAMVRYASERLTGLPRVRVFEADMRTFDVRRPRLRAGFAYNLINTVRHLESDAAVLSHLASISRVLMPGGVYAVGIGLSLYGAEIPTEDSWRGRRGACEVRQLVQYIPALPRTRRERVISHLTVKTPAIIRHIDERYDLRTYDISQWERLVARSALRIEDVVDDRGYQDMPRPPGYWVYVLRPRGAFPRFRRGDIRVRAR